MPPSSFIQEKEYSFIHTVFNFKPSSMSFHDFPTREMAEKPVNEFVGKVMNGMWGIEERWIKYYSSRHSILLVGDGDFSFSLCLGMAFGSAANIVATSLDTYDVLINKYKNARANIDFLKSLGATVLLGVDATQMKNLPVLAFKKFHRIIYNFPHAGFYGKEENPDMISMHKDLVRGFLSNASSMVWLDGEIHINHKTKAPFDQWEIENLGLECSLICTGQDEFKIEDYPGYCNKRGAGSRSDEPFPLGACSTFKFKLSTGLLIKRRRLDVMLQPPQMIPTPLVNPLPAYDVNALHNYGSEGLRKHGARVVKTIVRTITCEVYHCVEESVRTRVRYVNGCARRTPASFMDVTRFSPYGRF